MFKGLLISLCINLVVDIIPVFERNYQKYLHVGNIKNLLTFLIFIYYSSSYHIIFVYIYVDKFFYTENTDITNTTIFIYNKDIIIEKDKS